jgi:hypothetical protein
MVGDLRRYHKEDKEIAGTVLFNNGTFHSAETLTFSLTSQGGHAKLSRTVREENHELDFYR